MRLIVGVGILFLTALATAAFGQRNGPYNSLGGYGNVLYPGTGHAPNAALNLNNTFPVRLGNTVAGYPVAPPRYAHRHNSGAAIVPYPVFIGGGYYGPTGGAYAPDPNYVYPQQDPQMVMAPNGAPSVIINQNFIPDRAYPVVQNYGDQGEPQGAPQSGMKLYQSPSNPYADRAPAPQTQQPSTQQPVVQQPQVRTVQPDDQPTIYLLAFKDHNIVPALGYWMEGNTLHYVSVEHSMNQVSLDLIDRDLSQRLNDERGVEFKLPK